MSKLHLMMPMGGRGQRFFDDGFIMPKPLIEINGKPFFYWSAMSVLKYIPDCDLTFIVLKEHIDDFNIDKQIYSYFPDARITIIDHVLDGAVLTCMAGADTINDDIPLLFNDCDHMFRCDALTRLIESNDRSYDGMLLTFKSDSPKYSFVICGEDGNVRKTVEKQAVSSDAICGAYYFRSKEIFLENAEKYLKKCSYSEYFVSGVYNIMAENGLQSGILETDFHISFGTPAEFKEAESRPEFSELT